MRGSKGAHTCKFYRPCIRPTLVCKTVRRLFQSPYGICTGPHCIRRGKPSETRGVHVRVHAILGQKSEEHTENRERMWQFHRSRVISYGLPTDHSLLWLPKSYELGHTRGSHACDLSIRYFMPRSYEALGQSAGPRKGQTYVNTWEITRHVIASPHDVDEIWIVPYIPRLKVEHVQIWATSDSGPIEGQLVVFLALTGQMSHNRVWLGKYNPSVHSRASPDPVLKDLHHWSHRYFQARTASARDRTVPAKLNVRMFQCPYGIHRGFRVLAREPHGIFKVHVRYLATPWPNNTQITRTPVGMWPQRNAYERSRAVGRGEP